MTKKTNRSQHYAPDILFQIKEMSKRIKFILKSENLYQNREDSNGYICNKINESNPQLILTFNCNEKLAFIYKLLTEKYNYICKVNKDGNELYISNKQILDISDIEIDDKIKIEDKRNIQNFDKEDLDNTEDPKLKSLRSTYKNIIGAIRYNFPMDYGFNKNSSNGYRATRIKSEHDTFFMMQFPNSELTDQISDFLFKNGYKVIKDNSTTLKIYLIDLPEKSEILKTISTEEFSPDQLSEFWDLLNANGLVLLDVNNQCSIIDLFNGRGLNQIDKSEFIKIIKNQ